ncbi:unnamed protein product [Urochloa humidicola]
MRKLRAPRGGGEKVGVLALEVAALMSRAAGLWRALGDAHLARLRGEAIRLEGVRRLVADDDAALLSLALAEAAAACRDLARAVSRLSARCADPLLRRFDDLFANLLLKNGAAGDPHGLRYAAEKKMDRKARKMQRLVAFTAHLCHELDVLADLDQALRRDTQFRGRAAAAASGGGGGSLGETARRVARQRQEVERLRSASLWNRTFDYAVRLLARSLFTIVARITEVFDLEPTTNVSMDDDFTKASRLSWSSSFVSGSSVQSMSMVYPSDDVAAADTPRWMPRARSGKFTGGDARRFLMSRSKSLRQQLKWPASGKHLLVGCVVMGSKSNSPVRNGWIHGDAGLPLSFSYVSVAATNDDYYSRSISNFHSQAADGSYSYHTNAKPSTTTAVFESTTTHGVLAAAPATCLGGAALALHYANLIMLIEKLAVSPHHICSDERDELYGMLTGTVRASLRARLRAPFAAARNAPCPCNPVLAAEWSDTVQRILGWLAPLAHNMVRWQAERNFEQRNVASSDGVLLLETLHFADRRKTEAAVIELLVGLNYLWRFGRELEGKDKLEESAGGGNCNARAVYAG